MHIGFQNSIIAFLVMSLSLGFYAIYFYALSIFFKIFTQTAIFAKDSIQKLRLFSKLNLVPLCIAIVTIIYHYTKGGDLKMDSEYALVTVQTFIALIVYFYLDVVRKGKMIKEENDLTI